MLTIRAEPVRARRPKLSRPRQRDGAFERRRFVSIASPPHAMLARRSTRKQSRATRWSAGLCAPYRQSRPVRLLPPDRAVRSLRRWPTRRALRRVRTTSPRTKPSAMLPAEAPSIRWWLMDSARLEWIRKRRLQAATDLPGRPPAARRFRQPHRWRSRGASAGRRQPRLQRSPRFPSSLKRPPICGGRAARGRSAAGGPRRAL